MNRCLILVNLIISTSCAVGCAPTSALRPLAAIHARTIEHCADQNLAVWSGFRESMSRLAEIERIALLRHHQQRILLRYGYDDPAEGQAALREDIAALESSITLLSDDNSRQLLLDHPIAGEVVLGYLTEAEAAQICHQAWLHADEMSTEELGELLQPFTLIQQWETDVSTMSKALDVMQETAARHDELALKEARLIERLAHGAYGIEPPTSADTTIIDPTFRELLLNSINHEPTRAKVAAVLDKLLLERNTQR